MKNYLIIDSREQAVIPFIETEFHSHEYVVKQVTTADYLICSDNATIKAAIERKTLEDFAASFKDGRYKNIEKMRELRRATGCQLYYFVEGPAFPGLNRQFANVQYRNILSAITMLMVRDNIFIVQTENPSHTAKRLVDFMNTFDSTPNKETIHGGAVSSLPIPDILIARTEETDDDIIVEMWSRLSGISMVLGKIISRTFTIADIAMQKISIEQIQSLKTATGRSINKDAIASLIAIRDGSIDHAVKLLSGMRNVTPAVASIIINSFNGLSNLCDQPVTSISEVKIQQKTRVIQFGKIRAERVWRILRYSICA